MTALHWLCLLSVEMTLIQGVLEVMDLSEGGGSGGNPRWE